MTVTCTTANCNHSLLTRRLVCGCPVTSHGLTKDRQQPDVDLVYVPLIGSLALFAHCCQLHSLFLS